MFLLVGKWFAHPVWVFCTHLEAPQVPYTPTIDLFNIPILLYVYPIHPSKGLEAMVGIDRSNIFFTLYHINGPHYQFIQIDTVLKYICVWCYLTKGNVHVKVLEIDKHMRNNLLCIVYAATCCVLSILHRFSSESKMEKGGSEYIYIYVYIYIHMYTYIYIHIYI